MGAIATNAYSNSLIGWPYRGPSQDSSNNIAEGVRRYDDVREYDRKDRFDDGWFCSVTVPTRSAPYMSDRGDASQRRQRMLTQRDESARQQAVDQETERHHAARLKAQLMALEASYFPLETKYPDPPNWFTTTHHRERQKAYHEENEMLRLQGEMEKEVLIFQMLEAERNAAEAFERGEGPLPEPTAAETRAATRATRRKQLERLIERKTAEGKHKEVQDARAELSRLAILAMREEERKELHEKGHSVRTFSTQSRPTLVHEPAKSSVKKTSPHAKGKNRKLAETLKPTETVTARRSTDGLHPAAFPRWQQKSRRVASNGTAASERRPPHTDTRLSPSEKPTSTAGGIQ